MASTDDQRPNFSSQEQLIEFITAERDLKDSRVLAALHQVPRWRFLPPDYTGPTHEANCVVMPGGYTISEPGVVGCMVEALDIQPGLRILDVGSGSGYHAAVMSQMGAEVYGIDIIPAAVRRAKAVLQDLNYDRIHLTVGDAFKGWAEYAPFDRINIACSTRLIPDALIEQLDIGGLLIVPLIVSDRPIEEAPQNLTIAKKVRRPEQGESMQSSLEFKKVREVRFMPMSSGGVQPSYSVPA